MSGKGIYLPPAGGDPVWFETLFQISLFLTPMLFLLLIIMSIGPWSRRVWEKNVGIAVGFAVMPIISWILNFFFQIPAGLLLLTLWGVLAGSLVGVRMRRLQERKAARNKGDIWICSGCGEENDKLLLSCRKCGQRQTPEAR